MWHSRPAGLGTRTVLDAHIVFFTLLEMERRALSECTRVADDKRTGAARLGRRRRAWEEWAARRRVRDEEKARTTRNDTGNCHVHRGRCCASTATRLVHLVPRSSDVRTVAAGGNDGDALWQMATCPSARQRPSMAWGARSARSPLVNSSSQRLSVCSGPSGRYLIGARSGRRHGAALVGKSRAVPGACGYSAGAPARRQRAHHGCGRDGRPRSTVQSRSGR
jgi:hypothetical protein